jgi:hypothetical protein
MNNEEIKEIDRIVEMSKELDIYILNSIKDFFTKYPNETREDEGKILFLSIPVFLGRLSFHVTDEKGIYHKQEFIKCMLDATLKAIDDFEEIHKKHCGDLH